MNMLKTGLFLILFVLYACNPCNNLDCAASSYSVAFRITRVSDSTDLVFGPNRTYDRTKIRVYALNGRDTTFFECKPFGYRSAGYDSLLLVDLTAAPPVAFIRLDDTDTDTLSVAYKTISTKCCGTITEITSLRLNNNVEVPGGSDPLVIRK